MVEYLADRDIPRTLNAPPMATPRFRKARPGNLGQAQYEVRDMSLGGLEAEIHVPIFEAARQSAPKCRRPADAFK